MESNLETLGNEATSAIQNQYPSLQLLRDALTKKFSTENPLIQRREAALKNFLASPEEAIQKYSQPENVTIGGGQAVAPGQNPVGEQVTVPNVYLSPTQQRALYSREVANKFAPLSSLNDLLMLQSGGIESVLSAVNEGMKGDIEAKKFKFDTAKALEELRIRAMEAGQKGTSASTKRTEEATDQYIADLAADVAAELKNNPNADKKSLIWKWINTNEPYFAAAGVDSSKLWDIYDKTISIPKPTQPTEKSQGLWQMIFGGK